MIDDPALRYRLDGSIVGLPVRYCGTRETFDREERVYVERGRDDQPATLLVARGYPPGRDELGNAASFGWGYSGGGPLSLGLAILYDFYRVKVGAEAQSWIVEHGVYQEFTHRFLDEAPHLWMITDEDIRDFVGRWAAGELLVDQLQRRLNPNRVGAGTYDGQQATRLVFLRSLVPDRIRDAQVVI